MNFLVDAQLPRLLAIRLAELGHPARHTLDLPCGNRSADHDIAAMADREDAVVVTKDADFLDSHLLVGSPARLLLVSTGNISNRQLLDLFEAHTDRIVASLTQASLVELTRTDLVIHD
jgi:predicted nuclease of predicted toxin-antitoxin system